LDSPGAFVGICRRLFDQGALAIFIAPTGYKARGDLMAAGGFIEGQTGFYLSDYLLFEISTEFTTYSTHLETLLWGATP
jgi:hypothetical protein